ncbi:MAG: hypothetical protein ABEK17_02380 [Candidatus Aenigmatarchaeota archaeon]
MTDNKPVKAWNLGNVTVSVWNNDGRYSISIKRSYKDKDGKWQDSKSFFPQDISSLNALLEKAQEYILAKQE